MERDPRLSLLGRAEEMWLSWGLFGVEFRWLEREEKLRCRNLGVRVGGWCPTNDGCLGPEFLVHCVNIYSSGFISTVLYITITYSLIITKTF